MTNNQSKSSSYSNGDNKNNRKQFKFDLSIATLNARGLRCVVKRRSVFQYLKNLNIDIIFLQETYCTNEFVSKFDDEWDGKVLHSVSNSSHCKGVAILFKKGLDIQTSNVHRDDEGRRLFVNIKVNDEHITLANLYAPSDRPERRIEFFKRSSTWIKQLVHNEHQLIVGGDFNSVLSAKGRTSGLIDRSTTHLQNLINYLDVLDIWGDKYPNEPGYTYVNPANPNQMSRIDHLFISPVFQTHCSKVEIKIAPVPDHKLLVTTLKDLHRKRGNSYWKLNTSFLDNDDYIKGIEKTVRDTKKEYSAILSKRDLLDFSKARVKEYSIWFGVQTANKKKDEVLTIEKKITELDSNICLNPEDAHQLKVNRNILKSKLDDIYKEKARGGNYTF